MRTRIVLCVIVCFGILGGQVRAWNKAGHMCSAAIAYADLKANKPAVLSKVIDALKEHPHFDSLWRPRLEQVPQENRDLYLFMLAARWADDIRGDEDFDNPNAHFVNIPFRPGSSGLAIPTGDSILTYFAEQHSIARTTHDDEDKAVAICWMFHLIGDIHQPLHTTNLVNQRFPNGDRGGTRFYIRVNPGSSTISLHKYWDGLIVGSERFQTVRNRATELANTASLKRDQFSSRLAVTGFSDWSIESYNIATASAYLNGSLHGSASSNNGVVLPSSYKSDTKKVAEKQMALAGYRISDAMAALFSQ